MTIPPRLPDDPIGYDPYHRPELEPPEYEPPYLHQRPGVSPAVAVLFIAAAFILVFGGLFWWWFG